jgi:hypothetical protein
MNIDLDISMNFRGMGNQMTEEERKIMWPGFLTKGFGS